MLRFVDCRDYEGLSFLEFSKALVCLHLQKRFETYDEAEIAEKFGSDALQTEFEQFPEFVRQLV
jgi:hypothetical protein